MPSMKKIQQVQNLEQFLDGATIVIGTNYAGMTVAQMEALRRVLRQSGLDYRVVKNRLASRAAGHLGGDNLDGILQGPTALVVGRTDVVEPARALTSYVRTTRLNLPLTGAVVNGRTLTPAEVEALATLPPREILLGQVLGGMQGVLRGLVTVLNAHLAGVVTVLEARRRQLEERS